MKKILFVCSGNVGRSQMAEGYYNHLTQTHDATSAGIDPSTPAKYPQLPDYICEIMAEEGIDVSHQQVKLITEHMTREAEEVFVMCPRESCPDYLVQSNKVTYWQIEDPFETNSDKLRKIRDQIKKKIRSILQVPELK